MTTEDGVNPGDKNISGKRDAPGVAAQDVPLASIQTPQREVEDVPEYAAGAVPAVVTEYVEAILNLVPALRHPVPPRLSDGDRLAVQDRRSRIAGQVAFSHGCVVGALAAARGFRNITFEQFKEQVEVLRAAIGE